jgi:hypothetical protein
MPGSWIIPPEDISSQIIKRRYINTRQTPQLLAIELINFNFNSTVLFTLHFPTSSPEAKKAFSLYSDGSGSSSSMAYESTFRYVSSNPPIEILEKYIELIRQTESSFSEIEDDIRAYLHLPLRKTKFIEAFKKFVAEADYQKALDTAKQVIENNLTETIIEYIEFELIPPAIYSAEELETLDAEKLLQWQCDTEKYRALNQLYFRILSTIPESNPYYAMAQGKIYHLYIINKPQDFSIEPAKWADQKLLCLLRAELTGDMQFLRDRACEEYLGLSMGELPLKNIITSPESMLVLLKIMKQQFIKDKAQQAEIENLKKQLRETNTAAPSTSRSPGMF